MFDARRLLDALVGAATKQGTGGHQDGAQSGGQGGGQGAAQGGIGDLIAQILGQPAGGTGRQGAAAGSGQPPSGAQMPNAEELVARARDYMGKNPGMTQAALAGVAGLLLTSKKARGLAFGAARLGGVALVGTLAYRALQDYRAKQGGGLQALSDESGVLDLSRIADDDALLYVRAMVAAAAADGHIDQNERARLVAGMQQAGLDAQTTDWLDRELAAPADVDELARRAETPEKAAQVYAAARVAIDPDTLQEREFLRRLREALGLDEELTANIDAAAATIKAEG